MTPLTDPTLTRLVRLFKECDRAEAIRLLTEDCTAKSMHFSSEKESEVERCRFAALKLSGGRLDALVDAIALAQTDYRDLLMAADFGDDIYAHLKWMP
jgi:hypothetical protein